MLIGGVNRRLKIDTEIIFLLAILVIGISLRFSIIGNTALSIDEALKYDGASAYRNGYFWVDIDHPPINKYLIALSTEVIGKDELAIRLPNFFLSIATIFLVYAIGKKIYNKHVGVISAFIISFCNFHIGYSGYAKEDQGLSFFLTLAIYIYITVHSEKKKILLTSIICGLAIATKYSGLLFPAIFFLHLSMTSLSSSKFLTELKKKAALFLAMYIIAMATFFIVSPWILIYFDPFMEGLKQWYLQATTGFPRTLMGIRYVQTPFWYYLPLFLFSFQLPLTLFFLLGLIVILKKSKKSIVHNKYNSLIILWFLLPFLFYSLILSSALRYAMVFIPPITIIGAKGFFVVKQICHQKKLKKINVAILATMFFLPISAIVAYPMYREYKNPLGYFVNQDIYGPEAGNEGGGIAEKDMYNYMKQEIKQNDTISTDIYPVLIHYYLQEDNDQYHSIFGYKNIYPVWQIINLEDAKEKNISWFILHEWTLHRNITLMNYLRENCLPQKITYWKDKPFLYAYKILFYH